MARSERKRQRDIELYWTNAVYREAQKARARERSRLATLRRRGDWRVRLAGFLERVARAIKPRRRG